MISFKINKARKHGGALVVNSIKNYFRMQTKFSKHSKKVMTIITNDEIISILEDHVNRYIKICILFDSLFFPFENTMWGN